MVESPPAYAPQSNGSVERGGTGERFDVHSDVGTPGAHQGGCPGISPGMLWLVERAAELLTTLQVGHGGETPFERLARKPCRGEGSEFGEKVFYIRNRTASGSWRQDGPRACGFGADGAPTPTS